MGWIRWRATCAELGRAQRLLRLGDECLARGFLNIAEPQASQAALLASLRPPAFTDAQVQVTDRTAFIELTAPPNRVPTTTIEFKRRGKQVTSTQKARPIVDVNRDYAGVVTDCARAVVHTAFRTVPGLRCVTLSIFQTMMHPTRGHYYRGCVISAQVDRGTWDRIVHANASSENALRNFPFNFRIDKQCVLQEVPPMGAPQRVLPAAGPEILPHDLDPLALETLVRDLLRAMGWQADLTQASHDGGIDIEATNPQPVVGGKVIVQCKRHAGTIGSSPVRDLYGVVTAQNATKGILFTTSSFSPDARTFAEGKQLELIDGAQLAHLLRQHGISAAAYARQQSAAPGVIGEQGPVERAFSPRAAG